MAVREPTPFKDLLIAAAIVIIIVIFAIVVTGALDV